MLWVYDDAIVEDLRKSFNPNNVPNPAVTVIDPENAIGLAAQIQEDKIQFPVVVLTRSPNIPVNESTRNFTKTKKGVPTTFDDKNNVLYHEKTIPIDLSYELSAFTTNTADMDEIIRELIFKYSSMYFLTAKIPYESKRNIQFGVIMDSDGIEQQSTSSTYISEGKLHASSVTLKCEGCVLVHYTPRRLQRVANSSLLVTSNLSDSALDSLN